MPAWLRYAASALAGAAAAVAGMQGVQPPAPERAAASATAEERTYTAEQLSCLQIDAGMMMMGGPYDPPLDDGASSACDRYVWPTGAELSVTSLWVTDEAIRGVIDVTGSPGRLLMGIDCQRDAEWTTAITRSVGLTAWEPWPGVVLEIPVPDHCATRRLWIQTAGADERRSRSSRVELPWGNC